MSDYQPWDEIPPEREEALINSLAKHVVRYGLEEVAEVFLESIKPVSRITALTTGWIGSPVLEFFNIPGYDYSKLFSKTKNIDKLIERIYDLREEKRQTKK